MKKTPQIIIAVLIIAGFGVAWKLTKKEAPPPVTNFEECVKAGNPVMESYPRQCRHNDQTFTEEIKTECKKDADCPSTQYVCQEIQGTGTACPSTDPSCVPTHTIIKGECKLKEGNQCRVDSDCASGNLCNKNICTSPIGRQCSGPSDKICPTDFECVQGCGSPVGYPGEPPPPYFCQLKGYIRTCPICLAKNTLIDTPLGAVPVEDLQKGALVWTVTTSGGRVLGVVIETKKTLVPFDHKMVNLVFNDGRTLLVSPGHPTVDGRTAGDLTPGDWYDGARVVSSNRILYRDGYTYDILLSGETGFYFANGILLDSTLRLRTMPNPITETLSK